MYLQTGFGQSMPAVSKDKVVVWRAENKRDNGVE
jgi:hypothetical protein